MKYIYQPSINHNYGAVIVCQPSVRFQPRCWDRWGRVEALAAWERFRHYDPKTAAVEEVMGGWAAVT